MTGRSKDAPDPLAGLTGPDLAMYLMNDGRMMQRTRFAFLRVLRAAARGTGTRGRYATWLLGQAGTFDRAFREHYYPALLSSGIDHHTSDDDLAADCDDLLTSLSDVEGLPDG